MAASISRRLTAGLHSVRRNAPPSLSTYAFSSTTAAAATPPPPSPEVGAAAASSSSQIQVKERGKWSKLLLFLPGAITFGLGTWQLFRRQEKIEMLDYRRKRLGMEPVMCNELLSSSNCDLSSLEFRRVMCEGYFDESKSIFVGPRSRSISGVTENGYYVITPLILRATEPGSMQLSVLVNRGWVPRSWRSKPLENSENAEQPSNPEIVVPKHNERIVWWKFWSKRTNVPKDKEPTVPPTKVIGVVRGSEKPSIFVPENDPSSGQWFYIDVPMIARASGLPEDTLYVEDINENVNASSPYPVPKDVSTLIHHSVMPQDHLNYMMTWYSLSAAVTFMALRCIRPKKIRR